MSVLPSRDFNNFTKEFVYNFCLAAHSILGYTHTEAAKAAISAALLGKLSGKNNPNFGHTGAKHPMYGKPGANLGITPANAIKVYLYSAPNNNLISEFSPRSRFFL